MDKYNLNAFGEELQSVTLRINPELYKKIKIYVARNGMTISGFVNQSLLESLVKEDLFTDEELELLEAKKNEKNS